MKKNYQELLESSKQLPNKPFVIKDFISADEHKLMCDLFDRLPVFAEATHARAIRKDYLMHNSTNKITQNIFLEKIQNIWPDKKIKIDGGNFTEWLEPVRPHTDAYQFEYTDEQTVVANQEVLSYAILVPLSTDTGKGTPHTIFFDQYLYDGSVRAGLDDIKEDFRFTNKPFDKTSETYVNYLDYIPDKNLYGLSVDNVIPWEYGTAVVWHRAQFHCSSKFKDYSSKTHLLFLLSFIDDN